MRKIPIPLIMAAVFLSTVGVYLTLIVNTRAPPIWTSVSNNTLVFVAPQTYFIYGTEFNRITDGRLGYTISILGSRLAQIAVNDTNSVPWIIVSESRVSGTVFDPYYNVNEGVMTWDIPMLLAMAYNESQLASKYGTNTICVMINRSQVTLQVNPTGAPGYIALGWALSTSTSTIGTEVEYYYIGKVTTPNGFTWYLYLAAPIAGAPTGKITLSSFGCTPAGSFFSYGEFTGWGISGYLAQITITPIVKGGWSGKYTFTQVANVTTSTTAVAMPAGSASTIYGPDGFTIGVALPLESYAFPVNNGPVKITYSP